LQESLQEILDNPEPDRLKQEEIKTLKQKNEAETFDIDHYMYLGDMKCCLVPFLTFL